MTISISQELPLLNLSISIYYWPELDIRVKTYGHLNFPCASRFNFEHLNILCSGIGIRVKSYDHLYFSRASVVQFQASQYIIGLNRTSESKIMDIWICLVLWCLISSISIYYMPQSDIRVKSYDHSNFSRAFFDQFQASRYIISLNWTSKSKVMVVRICIALWYLISSISVYYAPESDL